MQTKRCTKCGRELPLSLFGKRGEGKLNARCRECLNAYNRAWMKGNGDRVLVRQIEEAEQRERELRTLGGWKMYVLNYASQRERNFNAVSTAGDVFKTNDKREFLAYLEKVL